MSELRPDIKPLFTELSDIPRLREIALEREFTRPVRLRLVNEVELLIKENQKLKSQLASCANALKSAKTLLNAYNDGVWLETSDKVDLALKELKVGEREGIEGRDDLWGMR